MRRIALHAAKIGISVALLYVSLRGVNLDSVGARISQIAPLWLLAACVAVLVQVTLGALRWQQVTAKCDAPLSALESFRITLIGTFFNQTLPSSIGGDAVRLWLLAKSGAGWRAATYSVLVDRAIGLIALALVVVACLPWSYFLIGSPVGRIALLIIAAASLGGGLAFLAFGRLRWSLLHRFWPTRHVHALSVVANRVLFDPRRGLPVMLTSLAIHLVTVVIAWCAARSIAANVSIADLLLLVPPIMLITMLPISIAGWGVRESAMMVAFGYAGLVRSDGLTVSLLFGAAMFVIGGIGGIVWILTRGDTRSMDKDVSQAQTLPDND